jgi:SAM-dependent methyltransferase
MTDHQDNVLHQFDPRATAYLHSAVHAVGPDLDAARPLLAPHLPDGAHALDVGCGGGHMAFLLAALGAHTVASDPSPQMLAAVQGEATRRGLSRLRTREAAAGRLSFDAASFDVVATRYSAHHWTCLRPGLAEMRRVLKPGGRLLVIDVLGQDSALVDTHFQTLELLRDRSHVRNRSAPQWRAALAEQGFEVEHAADWPLRLDFASWVERMQTPPAKIAMLRTLQLEAPAEVQQALAIERDGSFTARTGLFVARPR